MMMRSSQRIGWRFTNQFGTSAHVIHAQVVGKRYNVHRFPKPIKVGRYGLHSSEGILSALWFAPLTNRLMVHRTLHGGEMDSRMDQFCSTSRTILWQADATEVLHRFALEKVEKYAEAVDITPSTEFTDCLQRKEDWIERGCPMEHPDEVTKYVLMDGVKDYSLLMLGHLMDQRPGSAVINTLCCIEQSLQWAYTLEAKQCYDAELAEYVKTRLAPDFIEPKRKT